MSESYFLLALKKWDFTVKKKLKAPFIFYTSICFFFLTGSL